MSVYVCVFICFFLSFFFVCVCACMCVCVCVCAIALHDPRTHWAPIGISVHGNINDNINASI